MSRSTSAARKAAYWFLAVCCGALLAFGGFRLYEEFGPSKVSVDSVPFGIPGGSTVVRGDTPDMNKQLDRLPPQTQTEVRRAFELSRSGSSRPAYEILDAVVLLFPNLMPAVWGEVNTLFTSRAARRLRRETLRLPCSWCVPLRRRLPRFTRRGSGTGCS